MWVESRTDSKSSSEIATFTWSVTYNFPLNYPTHISKLCNENSSNVVFLAVLIRFFGHLNITYLCDKIFIFKPHLKEYWY